MGGRPLARGPRVRPGADAGHRRNGTIYNRLREHAWLAVVAVCFLTIAGSYATTTHNRNQALSETCHFIDTEHDAERARLVQDLERIFRPPYRQTFPLSPRAAHKAYRDTRHTYNHVIDTRPSYCGDRDARRDQIKPFPPYSRIDPGP